jgi:hypothetical protein
MRESRSSPNLAHPQCNSSIRLRKRRDHVKQQFLKNRRSGDFGFSLSSEGVDTTDNTEDFLSNTKAGTLDPGPVAGGIQHNLRPLLRNKYRQHPLSDTEEYAGAVWGNGRLRRGGHPGGVKITDFGMIDQPHEITLSDKRYGGEIRVGDTNNNNNTAGSPSMNHLNLSPTPVSTVFVCLVALQY